MDLARLVGFRCAAFRVGMERLVDDQSVALVGTAGWKVRGMLRVGACQTEEVLGDVKESLACIERFAVQADAQGVDLLLFPECFLQGYLVEEEHLRRHALNLESAEFAAVIRQLALVRPALVFGLIEEHDGRYFNTAVVVRKGEVVGRYRKTHLVAGESLFAIGSDYPVFDLQGVRFGINICYDTQFTEAAAAVRDQGARLLLVPAQNMMRRESAERWKHLHNQIRAQRVRETGMWLVSSDVTGERDEFRIGYGPTSIMNPRAEVVARVPVMNTGMAVADIA